MIAKISPAFLMPPIWLTVLLIGICAANPLLGATLIGTYLAVKALVLHNYQLYVDSKNIHIDSGILLRSKRAIKLSNIDTVETQWGLFGRLLGYATIRVRMNNGTFTRLDLITNPDEFAEHIQDT